MKRFIARYVLQLQSHVKKDGTAQSKTADTGRSHHRAPLSVNRFLPSARNAARLLQKLINVVFIDYRKRLLPPDHDSVDRGEIGLADKLFWVT
jgi:hypothetical protein